MGGLDRGTRGTGREGKFGVYVEMDMKAVDSIPNVQSTDK